MIELAWLAYMLADPVAVASASPWLLGLGEVGLVNK